MHTLNTNTTSEVVNISLHMKAGDYVMKTIRSQDELLLAFSLRHRVFAESLRWVPVSENRLEIDVYDMFAIHFGVFDQHKNLLAYVRLLSSDQIFMIEKEFRCVIGEKYPLRKERDTCELTRFCVTPAARNDVVASECGRFNITALLFKGIYHYCLNRGIRFIYGVTDKAIHKFLNMKGYPYKMIEKPRRMPDGVLALAVVLDWREFESMNSDKRPELLEWYTQNSMSLFPRAMAIA
jgi:acyl homoserine lactone synthase